MKLTSEKIIQEYERINTRLSDELLKQHEEEFDEEEYLNNEEENEMSEAYYELFKEINDFDIDVDENIDIDEKQFDLFEKEADYEKIYALCNLIFTSDEHTSIEKKLLMAQIIAYNYGYYVHTKNNGSAQMMKSFLNNDFDNAYCNITENYEIVITMMLVYNYVLENDSLKEDIENIINENENYQIVNSIEANYYETIYDKLYTYINDLIQLYCELNYSSREAYKKVSEIVFDNIDNYQMNTEHGIKMFHYRKKIFFDSYYYLKIKAVSWHLSYDEGEILFHLEREIIHKKITENTHFPEEINYALIEYYYEFQRNKEILNYGNEKFYNSLFYEINNVETDILLKADYRIKK